MRIKASSLPITIIKKVYSLLLSIDKKNFKSGKKIKLKN